MSFDNKVMDPAGDPRRKRLRYQAWHRGMREMDLILGCFTDRHLSGFSTEEMDELEHLFAVADQTLFRWVSGQETAPEEYDTALLRRIKTWAAAALTT